MLKEEIKKIAKYLKAEKNDLFNRVKKMVDVPCEYKTSIQGDLVKYYQIIILFEEPISETTVKDIAHNIEKIDDIDRVTIVANKLLIESNQVSKIPKLILRQDL